MNLGVLAAFRGEAWARRVLRRTSPNALPKRPWPGKIADARRIAMSFGKPELVETLATIIQQHASATWAHPVGT